MKIFPEVSFDIINEIRDKIENHKLYNKIQNKYTNINVKYSKYFREKHIDKQKHISYYRELVGLLNKIIENNT